jgi:hypothetical protein
MNVSGFSMSSYRGLPVSTQSRDNFQLDITKGFVKSNTELRTAYTGGTYAAKTNNMRMNDKVEQEGVQRNLATMKRKTYTPAKAVKSSTPSGKEGLFDIRTGGSINDQTHIGNYLPETLKDRNRNKIYSSNAWSKNLDMMRSAGQSMEDVYNSMLLTTDTNIPKANVCIPSADERLRVSQEAFQRPYRTDGDKVLANIRMRNSPEKLERERRQREADVHLKNESVLQLGRYDLTANKFGQIGECDNHQKVSVDKAIIEEFGHASERNRTDQKRHKNGIYNANAKIVTDDDFTNQIKLYERCDFYNDSPGARKKMYNKGDFVTLVKKGEIYDVFPDDPTSHTAPILVEADRFTKKPVRTFATADSKSLYLIQKRDADDIYTLDGHKYDKDMIMLEIPYQHLEQGFRNRINNSMGGNRRNNGNLLDLSYDDWVQLSDYIKHNEDHTVRLKNNQLYNVVRDFEWNDRFNDNFKDKIFFVHPEVIQEEREVLRKKLRLHERGRQEAKEDNYIVNDSGNANRDYINANEIHPIGYDKKKDKPAERTKARNQPFRNNWSFESSNRGTPFIGGW